MKWIYRALPVLCFAAIAAMVAYTQAASPDFDGPHYDSGDSCMPISGGTFTGGLTLGGDTDYAGHSATDLTDGIVTCDVDYEIVGGNLCVPAPTSDTAPTDLVVSPAHCYAQGTQTASDLVLAGGIDENTITVTQAVASTDTVTLTVNGSGTTLTEGTDFDCLTSDTVCAAALAVAVTGVSGLTGSSVAGVVYVQPDDCSTYSLDMASADGGVDGNAFALAEGTDGQVLFPDGSSAAPGLANVSDTDMGLYRIAASQLGVAIGGNWHTTFRASELQTVGSVRAGVGGAHYWNNSTELRAPADGQMQICNEAETTCATLDFTTADTVEIKNKAGTGKADLVVSDDITLDSLLTFKGSVNYIHTQPTSGTTPTRPLTIRTGAQGNAGDYDSGAVDIYSGATTTDGDTGDISIYTGVAGAGAADAGSIGFGVHGDNDNFVIDGATGLSYPSTHTETIADNGGGTDAAATLTPTANFILCDCDDAQGCDITMGETGMASGMRVTIVGETATHCDFADTDGVSNLSAALQMDDDDTLELVYSVDEWVEVSRTDN